MDKRNLIFVILILFILVIPLVSAACSLGANPLSMNARALPGQTVEVTWNLYNLHGDRTTHVKVNIIEAPSDWEISFEPELHEARYEVMRSIETIEENVALEPEDVVINKPEIITKGIDYVKHPKQEGYILVKPVKINIKVPENAELWRDYNFVFEAQGNCFMEPGAVLPAVATQLELNVKTISETFTEEPVEEVGVEEEEKNTAGITGAVIGGGQITAVIILTVITFILAIIIISLLVRFKRMKIE
ncbi:MAG: hypothetical protein ABIJ23_03635 [Candidatus Magasanikbacteria bacterium]